MKNNLRADESNLRVHESPSLTVFLCMRTKNNLCSDESNLHAHESPSLTAFEV